MFKIRTLLVPPCTHPQVYVVVGIAGVALTGCVLMVVILKYGRNSKFGMKGTLSFMRLYIGEKHTDPMSVLQEHGSSPLAGTHTHTHRQTHTHTHTLRHCRIIHAQRTTQDLRFKCATGMAMN